MNNRSRTAPETGTGAGDGAIRSMRWQTSYGRALWSVAPVLCPVVWRCAVVVVRYASSAKLHVARYL